MFDDDDCKISRGLLLEILNTLCEMWKQKFRLKSSLNEFLNTSTVKVTLHLLSEKNNKGFIKTVSNVHVIKPLIERVFIQKLE